MAPTARPVVDYTHLTREQLPMSFTPALVRLNGIDCHCGLAAGGSGRVRLQTDPAEWPGYRVGTRVKLQRGRGDEWMVVESAANMAGLMLAVLAPTDPPPAAKTYWPEMGRAVGS